MTSALNMDLQGLLSAPKANVSKTGQEINQWFAPNIANWTTSYTPGQTYEGSNLELQLFRPEVQKYLASMGLDPNLMWDQQAYDPQGNPVTPKAFDPTKSILDNPDAYANLINSQSGSKGSKYLDDFLAKNDLGVRFGNTGNTYINQLYNKTSGEVLASDVNEDKMNFMQQNGWMIPLAALGGIAAMGPTALGEGAVGLGSTGASITGGGISAGGGGGFGAFAMPGGEALSPLTQGPVGATTYVPSLSELGVTLPESVGGLGTVAPLGGGAGLAPLGQGTVGTTVSVPSLAELGVNLPPSMAGSLPAGAGGGLLDQIKNSTIGKGIGQVADLVGGGTNLAGLVGAVAGGLGGGSGDQVATSQSKTDPRIDPYIYGDNGYLKALQAKYQANPSGINPLMQQGLDIAKQNLTDPAYAQTFQNMRSVGNGLLAGPMASNPFTNGQGGQVPQMGLLTNFNDRAKNMMFKGGGLLG